MAFGLRVLGVVFGHSNLAWAIALTEEAVNTYRCELSALFLERQMKFTWHSNMLLDNARSFFARSRRPAKSVQLVFLHQVSSRFINLCQFYPTRRSSTITTAGLQTARRWLMIVRPLGAGPSDRHRSAVPYP